MQGLLQKQQQRAAARPHHTHHNQPLLHPLRPSTTTLRPRPIIAAAAPGAEQAPTLLSRLGRVLREKAQGDYERFVKGTEKTRERLGLVEELLAFWSLEDYESQLEELEEALIASDFGPSTALRVVDSLRDAVKSGTVRTPAELRGALKRRVMELLQGRGGKKDGNDANTPNPPISSELRLTGDPSNAQNPVSVILVVGVNGAGKTTTIGKLASRLAAEGARVTLAPGDTFRAAAKEQLDEWARRSGAQMSSHFREGAKPGGVLAATINDARQKRDADVVVCDTAGRLHTAYALMEELAACRKAIQGACAAGGKDASSQQPDETLLVLDGTTGLNMLPQAREFNDAVPLTGLILTKLDGTARGGAVVSVVDALGLPVKFVGVGEGAADLQPFDAQTFVDALFPEPTAA
jgi:fused signal recognition particle receptor